MRLHNLRVKAVGTVVMSIYTTLAWSQTITVPSPPPSAPSTAQAQGNVLVGSIQLVDKSKPAIQTYNVAMETSFSFSKKTGLDKFVNLLDENKKKLYFKVDSKSLLIVATSSTSFIDIPAGGRLEKGASPAENHLYVGDYYLYRAIGQVQGDKLLLNSLEALGRKTSGIKEKTKK